jgi:hypothetical protein
VIALARRLRDNPAAAAADSSRRRAAHDDDDDDHDEAEEDDDDAFGGGGSRSGGDADGAGVGDGRFTEVQLVSQDAWRVGEKCKAIWKRDGRVSGACVYDARRCSEAHSMPVPSSGDSPHRAESWKSGPLV